MKYIVFLIPIIMIFAGFLMFRCPIPRNFIIGYRTSRSMKSEATWKFANQLTGKLWIVIGSVLLFVSTIIFVCFSFFPNIETLSTIIIGIQLFMMIVPIFFIETKLKHKFK